ncbi:MAG TPA: hypothetical protein VMY39_07485 [Planctomycetota bacterium]|nr:hypothetical protein [Planctomycetota bacterium]
MTRTSIEHLPVEAVVERDAWSRQLAALAREPLELCEDFPSIAARHEAWWRGEVIDRPLWFAARQIDPSRRGGKHLDLLLADPDRWFEESRADLLNTRQIGDALPSIRVDFGPVILGGLFGGRTEFGSNTTWTHPFIDDDWLVPPLVPRTSGSEGSDSEGSHAPDWTIDETGPFWTTLVRLMERVSADARGRYLVRTPDWGGSADVLLNLRGSEALCIDCLERPDVVKRAVDAIYPAWRRAWTTCHRIALGNGAGIIHWIGLWSNEPYLIPACDFNYLIGPREFDAIFLADIARQTATAGRGVFHLDGPGATKHIDALLEIPELRAIQYVTGAGTPAALPWVDMFRKIQSAGRSLCISCYAEEVMPLLDVLKPEGLSFFPYAGPKGVDPADVFDAMCRRFA